MASYRFSAQIIKRSEGRSATGAAAYRSGTQIECDHYGVSHDYTRKQGVEHVEILAPEDAPDWVFDRAALWNAVEATEKRKDAQLAREIQLSLPHELDADQRRELVRDYVQETFVARGMVADVAIHAPHRDGDDRNHHAHIMLTMRELEQDGFGKKVRAWNDKELVKQQRESWADFQNRALELAGHDARVDHRSYDARGIDQEPQAHEGAAATAMKRKGEETRIAAENERRAEANEARRKMHVEALKELARIAGERQRFEDWAAQKQGELDGAQGLSSLDMIRAQEHEADALEERLQDFYGESLATVEHAAADLESKLKDTRIFARLRRAFVGHDMREKLEAYQASIADAKQRMQEQRDALAKSQALERARIAHIQEQRRAQQHEGIERARERKEAILSDREASARADLQKAAEPTKETSAAEKDSRSTRETWEQFKARTRDNDRDFERE